LIVSPTGTTGIAAPWIRAALATADTRSLGTSGRAASWTRMTSASVEAASAAFASRWRNPWYTDAWRVEPPVTRRSTFDGSASEPPSCSIRSSLVTRTTRRTSGAAAIADRA
jgi:hypothetical protein